MHIGLFDSGVGGLTVLRELKAQIPNGRFTYLGDTARLPYGNKAPHTLEQYSLENVEFLEAKGVDTIVVACHSASSVCLDTDKTASGTPLFNVIVPSAREATAKTQSQKIGVLSTTATTRSGVYRDLIHQLSPDVEVHLQACPLLVPLVEEGLIFDEITEIALDRYLSPMLSAGVDTIVLGCTHYPILREPIQKRCGPYVTLIDPAQSIGQILGQKFQDSSVTNSLEIYLTDHSPHFLEHGTRLLGTEALFVDYPSI